ncbi:outer membrane protein assembly factor BamE [Roseovarius sp. SCSIO 43702]|uniref:outer membrane protein assembly factor BamE n=1 Tax=Roseovarius sp. SCSIO 43702 TaxID=2823043 RepID=UPI001C735815|nr:outer membrane protein assembly factor BamE [Roseovarius sp. SCSIO 43702]QYX58593.1 outer membrane protein assembly factor BamE [Roseovarius sp. SCSIO 43702]
MLAMAACTSRYQNHGYMPPPEDLQNIVVGVDTRATVDDTIGPPTTSGVLPDGNYYYVRSRVRHFGAFRPEVVDRTVLAISFDQNDTVRNIETFGLDDGRPVRLTRRVTDNSVEGNGFLRQVFGNIGRLNPGEFF